MPVVLHLLKAIFARGERCRQPVAAACWCGGYCHFFQRWSHVDVSGSTGLWQYVHSKPSNALGAPLYLAQLLSEAGFELPLNVVNEKEAVDAILITQPSPRLACWVNCD